MKEGEAGSDIQMNLALPSAKVKEAPLVSIAVAVSPSGRSIWSLAKPVRSPFSTVTVTFTSLPGTMVAGMFCVMPSGVPVNALMMRMPRTLNRRTS